MANTPKVSQVFSAARYLFWLLFFGFLFLFLVSVDLVMVPRCPLARFVIAKRAAWGVWFLFCPNASEGAERMCVMPSCGGKPLRVDALHLAMPLNVPSVCVRCPPAEVSHCVLTPFTWPCLDEVAAICIPRMFALCKSWAPFFFLSGLLFEHAREQKLMKWRFLC